MEYQECRCEFLVPVGQDCPYCAGLTVEELRLPGPPEPAPPRLRRDLRKLARKMPSQAVLGRRMSRIFFASCVLELVLVGAALAYLYG